MNLCSGIKFSIYHFIWHFNILIIILCIGFLLATSKQSQHRRPHSIHPLFFSSLVIFCVCVCIIPNLPLNIRMCTYVDDVSLKQFPWTCVLRNTHHTVVLIAITLNLLGKLKRVILRWLAHRVFLLYSSQQYNRFSSLWFSLSFRRSHSSIFHSIEREWWVTEVGRSNRLTVPSPRLL